MNRCLHQSSTLIELAIFKEFALTITVVCGWLESIKKPKLYLTVGEVEKMDYRYQILFALSAANILFPVNLLIRWLVCFRCWWCSNNWLVYGSPYVVLWRMHQRFSGVWRSRATFYYVMLPWSASSSLRPELQFAGFLIGDKVPTEWTTSVIVDDSFVDEASSFRVGKKTVIWERRVKPVLLVSENK